MIVHIEPRRVLCVFAVGIATILCIPSEAARPVEALGGEDSLGVHSLLRKYLRPLIANSNLAVRFDVEAHCNNPSRGADPVPFPKLRLQAPSKGTNGLAAVREIFARAKDVHVTQDSGGIIRVRVGNVTTPILQTKISYLRLVDGQFNPDIAIEAMCDTAEMRSAMRSLKLEKPFLLGGSLAGPGGEMPHLPSALIDTTADKIIDLIAKTWAGEGFIVYGACAEADNPRDGQRLFYIGYYGDLVPRGRR